MTLSTREARHIITAEWTKLVASEPDTRPYDPVRRQTRPNGVDRFVCSARYTDDNFGVVYLDVAGVTPLDAATLRGMVANAFDAMVWEWRYQKQEAAKE